MAAEDYFDQMFSAPAVVQMASVMVDLETVGTRPNAPIIAIGACTFSTAECKIGEKFYVNVDLASAVASGAVIDADTFKFWMGQPDAARQAVFKEPRLPLSKALLDFKAWIEMHAGSQKDVRMWSCGTDFDITILNESFNRCVIQTPWVFYNTRDYRTIRESFRHIEVKRSGTHHNALDDAVTQAQHLIAIRKAQQGAK